MKTTRYLAAGLLLLTATFHIAQIALTPLDLTLVITVAFGVAYLIIGIYLLRDHQAANYFGAAVPFVGLVLATLGMLTKPTLMAAFFIAIDIVVVVCCLYLILHNRRRSHA
jgi:hypothetical protein